ncbi:MAG: phosphatase PAP2 family protein [Dehalococcoidia bacterium]
MVPWLPVTALLQFGIPELPAGINLHISWRWLIIGAAAVLFARFMRPKTKTTLPQVGRELAIVVPAYFAYSAVRNLAQGRASDAFHHAGLVIKLEREIGIFWEQQWQQRIINLDIVVTLMNWVYVWGFWPVVVLAAVWLFVKHRDSYPVYRNAVLISGALGLVVFATFPLAPPRYMVAWGFVDTVAQQSDLYGILHDSGFVNQFAAMPSFHFGWMLLVSIAIFRHGEGVLPRLLGVLLPTATLASIVLTANHYLIDGIAGGGLALLGLGIAWLIQKRFSHPDAGPHSGTLPPTPDRQPVPA